MLLLFASLLFYGWGEPRYVLLMAAVILLNYVCGRVISAAKEKGKSGKQYLILSVVLNLAVLGFFKYTDFLISTLNVFLPKAGKIPLLHLALPIGISFYIFQSMSYTIDVYRGDTACQNNPISFGSYVSLFPQLIAGPIVRYRDIAGQLQSRKVTITQFSGGIQLFVVGLAKKILLANKMGELCEALKDTNGSLSGWFCMFAYTFQIYYDFSGYSDMAVGLGKMFGFEFLPNFNYPYCSRSITEFWRKWHISLGTWFREYVYIPLGGNRKGLSRQILNLLIVWSLTGLWHGASWNFVLWGLFYALLLIAEKLFLLKWLSRLPGFMRVMLTFLAVSFGWVLFSYTGLNDLISFFHRLTAAVPENTHSQNLMTAYLPLMTFASIGSTPIPKKVFHRLDGDKIQPVLQIAGLAILLVLCVSCLASQSYNPFIYFRF